MWLGGGTSWNLCNTHTPCLRFHAAPSRWVGHSTKNGRAEAALEGEMVRHPHRSGVGRVLPVPRIALCVPCEKKRVIAYLAYDPEDSAPARKPSDGVQDVRALVQEIPVATSPQELEGSQLPPRR